MYLMRNVIDDFFFDEMSVKFVTPKQYYFIARRELAGHRQPLLAYDSKTDSYYMAGKIYTNANMNNFYKDYISILHHDCGIPNFEIDMNLKIVDEEEKKTGTVSSNEMPSLPKSMATTF